MDPDLPGLESSRSAVSPQRDSMYSEGSMPNMARRSLTGGRGRRGETRRDGISSVEMTGDEMRRD